MSQSFTRRLTAEERKAARLSAYYSWDRKFQTEPALGTLEERLDILIRRFGGQTQIRLTREERAELERARVA